MRRGGIIIKKQPRFVQLFVIGIVIVLLALAVMMHINFMVNHRVSDLNKRIMDANHLITELYTLEHIFQSIRLAQRGHLLAGTDDYLEAFETQNQAYVSTLSKIECVVKNDPEQHRLLQEIRNTYNATLIYHITPLFERRSVFEDDPSLIFKDDIIQDLLAHSSNASFTLQTLIGTLQEHERMSLEKAYDDFSFWQYVNWVSIFLIPSVGIPLLFVGSFLFLRELHRYRTGQEKHLESLRLERDRYEEAIRCSNLFSYSWDLENDVITPEERFIRLLGYDPERIQGMTAIQYSQFFHPDDIGKLAIDYQTHLMGKSEHLTTMVRMIHKDGHPITFMLRGQISRRSSDGEPLEIVGTYNDITEQVTLALAPKQDMKDLKAMFDTMDQGLAYMRLIHNEAGEVVDFEIVRANRAHSEFIGVPNEEILHRPASTLSPPLSKELVELNLNVGITGKSVIFETKDLLFGRYFRISSYQPEPGFVAMLMDDITNERDMEHKVLYERMLFETTLLSVAEGVISTDEVGIVQFINEAAEHLIGWEAEEAIGRPLSEIFHLVPTDRRKRTPDLAQLVLSKRESLSLGDQATLVARDGVERYISDHASPIIGKDGELYGMVIVFRDATEDRTKAQEMRTLSISDPLTSLYNRRHFDRIKEEINNEPYQPLTLVLADVNGLKLTNDAFGHDAGDELLRKVAAVMKRTCRENDIIFRVGGDEFVLLLPQTDAEHAETILNRINNALKKEKVRNLLISVAFGSAQHNTEEGFETTFKTAEDRMYRNKLKENVTYKRQMIVSILDQLYEKEESIEEHNKLVSSYAKDLAMQTQLSSEEVELIEKAALFHDLGKIAINKNILRLKTSQLTQVQTLELRRHPEIGYNILRSLDEYAPLAEAVLYHHERFDGNGYPRGLKGEEIPLYARIIAVANAWANLTDPNSTSEQTPKSVAVASLKGMKGTVLDPDLVDCFLKKAFTSR
ncbi:MAG: diguanylate cyclase [Sphaerochaeta sp.]|nr:MAG: diguanylate cyclase [Sphaerochaeta sp.]